MVKANEVLKDILLSTEAATTLVTSRGHYGFRYSPSKKIFLPALSNGEIVDVYDYTKTTSEVELSRPEPEPKQKEKFGLSFFKSKKEDKKKFGKEKRDTSENQYERKVSTTSGGKSPAHSPKSGRPSVFHQTLPSGGIDRAELAKMNRPHSSNTLPESPKLGHLYNSQTELAHELAQVVVNPRKDSRSAMMESLSDLNAKNLPRVPGAVSEEGLQPLRSAQSELDSLFSTIQFE